MSAHDAIGEAAAAPREEYPRFELSFLFDRQDEPSEITIYPASNEFDISTNWITIDVAGAVPLDEVP